MNCQLQIVNFSYPEPLGPEGVKWRGCFDTFSACAQICSAQIDDLRCGDQVFAGYQLKCVFMVESVLTFFCNPLGACAILLLICSTGTWPPTAVRGNGFIVQLFLFTTCATNQNCRAGVLSWSRFVLASSGRSSIYLKRKSINSTFKKSNMKLSTQENKF